jgi:hypothetical protein
MVISIYYSCPCAIVEEAIKAEETPFFLAYLRSAEEPYADKESSSSKIWSLGLSL